jgi:hypothetical protein
MTRRFIVLGVFVALSQLSSGCYWHHCGLWRWHCAPACSPCAPAYSPPACSPCAKVGAYHPGTVNGQPGGPIITNPTPIPGGPIVYPGQELPNPMPVKPQ